MAIKTQCLSHTMFHFYHNCPIVYFANYFCVLSMAFTINLIECKFANEMLVLDSLSL